MPAFVKMNTKAELQAWLRETLPLYEYIGLTIDSWGTDLQCSVPLSEANRNHFGAMHAAVQWAVAETLGGVAYFAHLEDLGDCWPVVEELSIHFLKPATTAIRARARFGEAELAVVKAELERRNKARYVIDVELVDESDGIVATAKGRYYLRRRTPPIS